MAHASLMRTIASAVFWASSLLLPAHAPAAQPGQDIVFQYGVVPAEVVLAHAEPHAERQMHGGAASRGSSHVVVALFDTKGDRIPRAEVTATVTLLGGPSETKRLERMDIAGQPSFGNFFRMGAPGTYRLRFEARRPGEPRAASAEFEYRVSPEGRR